MSQTDNPFNWKTVVPFYPDIYRIHVSTDNMQFVKHREKWKGAHFPILLDVQYFKRLSFPDQGALPLDPAGGSAPDPRYRLALHALAIKMCSSNFELF